LRKKRSDPSFTLHFKNGHLHRIRFPTYTGSTIRNQEGGEIMNRKPSSGEKELREAIRKLVREELQHLLRERRSRTGKPADSSIPRTSSAAELYPPGHADRPWAVFGVPRPDPEKHPVFPRGKPNTLPGWPEPFHPDFTGFDSPPYLPRKMNK
jgi:hypothetical protein